MNNSFYDHIYFLRNRPARFNLGDFLCTPMHYFDFGAKEYQTRKFLNGKRFGVILGGGAYNDLGQNEHVDFESTVAWGVGSSRHGLESLPTSADNLPFLLYGVRDIDAVSDDKKFLPCVSCLHPFVQLPPGSRTAVILNFDKGITDISRIKESMNKLPNVDFHTNNQSELAFMGSFASAGKVVTNSFHAAYWSLLSGRQVSVIGYSTKFRSLFRLAGMDSSLIRSYSVDMQGDLEKLIHDIIREDAFSGAINHEKLRKDCIDRNIAFAQRCVDKKFVAGFRLKSQSRGEMVARMLKYQPVQMVRWFTGK